MNRSIIIVVYRLVVVLSWAMVLSGLYWVIALYAEIPLSPTLRIWYNEDYSVGHRHGVVLRPLPMGGKTGRVLITSLVVLGTVSLYSLAKGKRSVK